MRPLLAFALVLLGACATTPPPLEEPLKVLLLGDSISIGYTPHVQRMLEGRAQVFRPTREGGGAENCAGTNNGTDRIADWLARDGGGWDVIHFNFGLHDLKRVDPETGKNSKDPGHPHQADPERYGRQLGAIVKKLEETGARLVFATTTPVPPGVGGPVRKPEDSLEYNRIALQVMDEAGIAVNDLFGFATERLADIQRPKDVHFSPEGSAALAEEVTRAILEVAGLE